MFHKLVLLSDGQVREGGREGGKEGGRGREWVGGWEEREGG